MRKTNYEQTFGPGGLGSSHRSMNDLLVIPMYVYEGGVPVLIPPVSVTFALYITPVFRYFPSTVTLITPAVTSILLCYGPT